MTLKVFGPYRRKDGRAHVIHYDTETKKRRTQSYPRFLMEEYLGRELEPWEQVDHINEDRTDDRIENYQILTGRENSQKSVIQQGRQAEIMQFICPVCGVEFEQFTRRYRDNQLKQGKSGPHCSNRCGSIAARAIQLGRPL